MPVSQQDIELLEQWLDGELSEEPTEALRRRLSVEPELSQVMDRLRGERQLRERVWSDLEPDEQEVNSLVGEVRRLIRKHELWNWRFRVVRNVSGVAASIVLVFMAGWISGNRLRTGAAAQQIAAGGMSAQPSGLVSAPAPLLPSPVVASTVPNVGLDGPRLVNGGGPVVDVSAPFDPNNELFNGPANRTISNQRPTFKVYVVDPWGRIVDAKQFESRQEARKFSERPSGFQSEPQHSQGIVPVTDRP